jgi:AP endonuclease-2
MASSLRIVSWNINGLSTIVHYHPWNKSPAPFKVVTPFSLANGQALLEQFDADIVCFQEHKLQRKDITLEMANIPGFDGYYSFSKVKKGYSGVGLRV